MKILLLETGNSCRSRMARGFLEAFDDLLTVRTAGTLASGILNEKAVAVMEEIGFDISHYASDQVEMYPEAEWDYVITVCGGANESCPFFTGKAKHRMHIGFDDPSHVTGTDDFILNEFRRVRDEIKEAFSAFYNEQILPQLSPDEVYSQMLESYTMMPPLFKRKRKVPVKAPSAAN